MSRPVQRRRGLEIALTTAATFVVLYGWSLLTGRMIVALYTGGSAGGLLTLGYLLRDLGQCLLLLGPILVWCWVRRVRLRPLLRPPQGALRGFAAVVCAAGFGAVLLTQLVPYLRLGADARLALRQVAGISSPGYLLWELLIDLLLALGEALLFRGGCYLILRRFWSDLAASILSAALFAVHHAGFPGPLAFSPGYLAAFFPLAALGLLLCRMDAQEDTVWLSLSLMWGGTLGQYGSILLRFWIL